MFWFNYRHVANAAAIYAAVKRTGIPDSQIILMLADDIACNARNSLKGTLFDDSSHHTQLFDDDVQVDYRGGEVTVQNLLRVLAGTHGPYTPASKRLHSNEHSRVLVYMTGHGGDQFIKFRDTTVLSTADIGDAVQQMKEKRRFKEMLIMVDTCQATTLFETLKTPGVLAIGSSGRGESSWSYTHDHELGVSVVDRFTYLTLKFFQRSREELASRTLGDMFRTYDPSFCRSNPKWTSTLSVKEDKVPILGFFGAELSVKSYVGESRKSATASSTTPEAGEKDDDETVRLFRDEAFWRGSGVVS